MQGPPAFRSELENLPQEQCWACKAVTTHDEGKSVAESIRVGTAVAVSDGSLKHDYGTSAFILYNPSTDTHV